MCKTWVNQEKNMGKYTYKNPKLSPIFLTLKNKLVVFLVFYRTIFTDFPPNITSLFHLKMLCFSTVYTPPTITTTYFLSFYKESI